MRAATQHPPDHTHQHGSAAVDGLSEGLPASGLDNILVFEVLLKRVLVQIGLLQLEVGCVQELEDGHSLLRQPARGVQVDTVYTHS